jgi:hypothetical protein
MVMIHARPCLATKLWSETHRFSSESLGKITGSGPESIGKSPVLKILHRKVTGFSPHKAERVYKTGAKSADTGEIPVVGPSPWPNRMSQSAEVREHR